LEEPRLSESKLISKRSRPIEKAADLAGVGERDMGFPLPHGRGDEFHHGSPGIDPRSLPPKGPKPRDIYVADLHIDSIKVKTRDFR
jgi:error-prone DNA polymerase